MIQKLLIANRGEIAVRIIRTARELGVKTVAVYSDADENAMHVRLADEAVYIGRSEPSESYLRGDTIIEAAKATGADAIHPGYGFLSERAEFSESCRAAGIVFVGPPAEAMRKLGAKIESKILAVQAGVPITPGFFEPGAKDEDLRRAAQDIGFPVMLKASAGGGGRGMRAVHDPADFDASLALARDEALKAFGDGEMMVEKLVEQPRHIEVQFIADSQGQVATLFERECSIQRRHQKLFEESPSPVLLQKPSLWEGLRDAVKRLVSAAGYVGAGTAEFIYDQNTEKFYFLEVNARLQVEHPVTEAITGLDLVEWQLRVASGEPLGFSEELLRGDRTAMRGHAIEVRIIAENPAQNFMPSIGKILGWAEPRGLGIRVDTGFEAGGEVSRFYDSMLAKLIVHADNRERAIAKLRNALLDFHILGVHTNIEFSLQISEHPDFEAGKLDTSFISREFSDWTAKADVPPELLDIASLLQISRPVTDQGAAASVGAWGMTDSFRLHK